LNQCSREEVTELVRFFQNNTQTEEFPGVEQVLPLLKEQPEMSEESSKRIFQEILQRGEAHRKNRRKTRKFPWRAAAAVLILGLLITGFYQQNILQPASEKFLVPGE